MEKNNNTQAEKHFFHNSILSLLRDFSPRYGTIFGEITEKNVTYHPNREEQLIIPNHRDILSAASILCSGGFEQLVDLCGVDCGLDHSPRFSVVYNFLSIRHIHRLRLVIFVDEKDLVPSLHSLYPSAGWYEREAWDMFGISFDGHPDLRRILTEYGFIHHPLRKDFPLSGHTEVFYDSKQNRVAHRKIHLKQEYRENHFPNNWHGTDYVLPGDEKAADGRQQWVASAEVK